jgi:hypothetical protein
MRGGVYVPLTIELDMPVRRLFPFPLFPWQRILFAEGYSALTPAQHAETLASCGQVILQVVEFYRHPAIARRILLACPLNDFTCIKRIRPRRPRCVIVVVLNQSQVEH